MIRHTPFSKRSVFVMIGFMPLLLCAMLSVSRADDHTDGPDGKTEMSAKPTMTDLEELREKAHKTAHLAELAAQVYQKLSEEKSKAEEVKKAAESRLKSAEKRLKSQEKEVQSYSQLIEDPKGRLKNEKKPDAKADIEHQIEILSSLKKKAEAEVSTSKKQVEDLRKSLQANQKKLDDLEPQLAQAREKLDSAEKEAGSASLKFVRSASLNEISDKPDRFQPQTTSEEIELPTEFMFEETVNPAEPGMNHNLNVHLTFEPEFLRTANRFVDEFERYNDSLNDVEGFPAVNVSANGTLNAGAGDDAPDSENQTGTGRTKSDPVERAAAEQVHVVLIATTDRHLPGARAGLITMNNLLATQGVNPITNVPPAIRLVNGGNGFTRQQAINEVKALDSGDAVKANHTVICYITTHGAVSNVGHFFETTSGESLPRSTLFAELKSLGAGQTILVSDSCTVLASGIRFDDLDLGSASGDDRGVSYLRALLFYGRGDIQISSSSLPHRGMQVGQYSWIQANAGGIFTQSFIEESIRLIPRTGDRVVSWGEFFGRVQGKTMNRWDDIRRTNGFPTSPRDQRPGIDPRNTRQTPQMTFVFPTSN